MAVGDTLTDDAYEEVPHEAVEATMESSIPEENLITLAHFQEAGFIYITEGDENWVLFLACSLNSTIRLQEVRGDGVIISWDATPLSEREVLLGMAQYLPLP